MTDARHLDELLSTLRREMSALDGRDDDIRQRLDRLIIDIEARATRGACGARVACRSRKYVYFLVGTT